MKSIVKFLKAGSVILIGCICFIIQAENTEPIDLSSNDHNTTISPIIEPLPTEERHPSKKIKIAILFDTSNSMDGLIDQAKSQLWAMVNKLADAQCDNLKPSLEIALYEYGNDRLQSQKGFIRQVTPLTEDLDQISEDLFGLRTEGGSEHCGQVIYTSLNELDWSESSDDLQLIFIAGNEPFTQGPISYYKACKQAKTNHVIVNTIFCGNFNEGINTNWKDGAILTNGEYMSIDHNSKTVYIKSPYDDKIANLNEQLNETYIYYGEQGKESKEKQILQDSNAFGYSTENLVSRTITKSKHVYKNSSWDLVDAIAEETIELEDLEGVEFNEEMKGLSVEEKKDYISNMANKRAEVQKEIQGLGSKRAEYIAQQSKGSVANSLENVMLTAISKQAKSKSITF